jgi:hypothetical protein
MFIPYESVGGGRVSALETTPEGVTILRVQAAAGVWWDIRVKDGETKEDVAARVDASLALINTEGERGLSFFRAQQATFDKEAKVWLPNESHEAWAARVRGDKPKPKPKTELTPDPRPGWDAAERQTRVRGDDV